MRTKTKLNAKEVERIGAIADRLDKLYHEYEENDILLHYGNGTVSEQLSCAIAALDTILQEY